MRIAINASRAINEKAGVGRVAYNLIKHLLEIDQKNEYLLFVNFMRGKETKNKIIDTLETHNSQIKISHWPGRLQEEWFNFNIPKNIKADVYLAPTFLDFQRGLTTPQIVIIHDLTNFLYPEHAGLEISKRYQVKTRLACKNAAGIIAVSEATKKDIIRLLNIDADKITVIHPGQTEFPKDGKLPSNLKPKTYLLFVGTIEPRKNLKNLLTAYSLLPTALKEKYPLVIVGGKGWNNNTELQEIGRTEGVKWLGYVSDADLGELYKNAKVFTYPSLYEGFGIPVIEAQQFGVPAVASNISSLPEAVGDGGILIDPRNSKATAEAIEKLLTDDKLYLDLSKKALINTKRFSWEKAAQETLKVLKSVS